MRGARSRGPDIDIENRRGNVHPTGIGIDECLLAHVLFRQQLRRRRGPHQTRVHDTRVGNPGTCREVAAPPRKSQITGLTGAIAVGAISGGAFNRAVAIAGAATGLFAWPTLWAYLVAQVVAGAAAGLTFLTLNPDDK